VDGQWEQKKVWRNADQATMPSFFLFFGCSFRFLSFLCPFRLALSSDCLLSLCSMYYDIYVNKSRDPQTIFTKERKKGHLHFCQHIYFSFSQNIIVCIFGIFQ